MIGGPVGLLLGGMLWTCARSVPYDGDRTAEGVHRDDRNVAKMKAVERCVRRIADDARADLHPAFREAFYGQGDRKCEDGDELARTVSGILASVDHETSCKFDRLYDAAVEAIG